MSTGKNQILCDMLFNKLSITDAVKKYETPLSVITAHIQEAIKNASNKSFKKALEEMLKTNIYNLFLNSPLTSNKLSDELDISEKEFSRIIYTIIDDRKIVDTDFMAERLFTKLMEGIKIHYDVLSERIINIVAVRYITTDDTFDELAQLYGISARCAGMILKHGIAKNILSDEKAEAIYSKAYKSKYHRKNVEASFEKAFEERRNIQSSENNN